MQRSKPIETTSVAISLLVLLLIANSCSAPNGSNSDSSAAPTPWPTPTQVSAQQPNSNGAMARSNVHGTGVYVTNGVRQLSGLKWEFKAGAHGSGHWLFSYVNPIDDVRYAIY